MKTHVTKSADSPQSTAPKGARPFFSQSPSSVSGEETDLEVWQERASRYGHYFDGPAIQAKGEAASSGSEPVIQRNGDEIDKLIAKNLEAFKLEVQQKKQQPPPQKTLKELARESDRQTLSGMFKIDEDDSFDPRRKSNVLTSAKFNEVADLYSRIREGGTSIKFAPNQSLGFEKGAMGDIAKILQTEQGRALLGDLSKSKHATTLGQAMNVLSAGQAPVNMTDASDPLKGTPSAVNYLPGAEIRHPQTNDVLATSDTVLFHELVHAHHTSQGTMVPHSQKVTSADVGLGHKDIGVNKEEYATVGLGGYANNPFNPLTENAYRAEQASLQTQQADKDKYKKRALYNYM